MSITDGADGFGVVSYIDETNDTLKVAKCGNIQCTTATLSNVTSAGPSTTNTNNNATSIVLQSGKNANPTADYPIIAYFDANFVKVAVCQDAACSSAATIRSIADVGSSGGYAAITIGNDGYPVVSYYDANGDGGNPAGVYVAHCSNETCAGVDNRGLVDSTGRGWTSVTVAGDGLPLVSYAATPSQGQPGLKIGHCSDVICASSTTSAVLDSGNGGVEYTAIATGIDGNGIVAYHKVSGFDLKVVHCTNVACSTSDAARLVDGGSPNNNDAGRGAAITIGSDGNALISYTKEDVNAEVRVAHCNNVSCSASYLNFFDFSAGTSGGLCQSWTGVAICQDGYPLIAYHQCRGDDTDADQNKNGDLVAGRCSNWFCIPWHRKR